MSTPAINSLTAWFLLAEILVIAIYDAFAVQRWGEGGTISRTIITLAMTHPIITLFVGIVIGHCFWPQIVFVDPKVPVP